MRRLMASLIAMTAIVGSVGGRARADLLYVATPDSPNVVVYDTAAGSPEPTTFATFSGYIPSPIAFGPSGDLFVSSYYSNSILEASPAGVVSTFASSPLLDFSTGLAFDQAGNLFATNNQTNGSIVEFTPGGAASVFANTMTPQGLAFDQAGNLFAAIGGTNTGSVIKFTPEGVASVFASAGLSNAYGLAFDRFGNLFVSSANNNTIFRYTPEGVASVFASGGILDSPTALAFDSAGNLWVGNSGNNQIQKFTPRGKGRVFATASGRVSGLAFRPASVPEPSSLALIGLGLVGLAGYAGWRRARP